MARGTQQMSLGLAPESLNQTTQTIKQQQKIIIRDLNELKRNYTDREDALAVRAAKKKVRDVSKMKDPNLQKTTLKDMNKSMQEVQYGGTNELNVSASDISSQVLIESRNQDAIRISTGLATATVSSAAYSWVSTMSERNGHGIAERRMKKSISTATKAASVAATFKLLGTGAGAFALAGTAIQYGIGEFAAQQKLNRENNDTAYRTSLLGPASYSGSR